MAVRFGVSSTVKNRLPRYSNFWDGTAVYNPFSPTGSYDALATYTVGSTSVSEIVFSGLPTGGQYSHLQIRAIARTNRSDTETTFTIRLNGDSSSVYSYHRLIGDGSSASASGGGSTSESYLYAGATGTSTSAYGASIWDILDFSSTTKAKTIRYLGGHDTNGGGRITLGSGAWYNNSAVNSIRIATDGGFNFTQYSQFSLYGVK